jgi:hypothetical protein
MIEPIYGTYKGSEIVIPLEEISWDSKRGCVKVVPQVVEQHGGVPSEIYLDDPDLSFPDEKQGEIEQRISELLGVDFHCKGSCPQFNL